MRNVRSLKILNLNNKNRNDKITEERLMNSTFGMDIIEGAK